MSGTKGTEAATLHLTACDNEKDVVSTARYIPMPESLWVLRHRFPNVTRSVLLQCVRCHRWVAQPVTTHPPDEVPACPTRLEKAALKFKNDRYRRLQAEEDELKEEWRSPRFRQNQEKIVNVVKPTKRRGQEEQKETNAYYIPNPANFTCQWVYCALEDVWTDLRDHWLGELYATLDSVRGDEEGGSSSNSSRLRCSQQSPKERLNKELVKELHGKRSERLARKPHNGTDSKYEKNELHRSAAEVSLNEGIAQQLDTLIRHDEAVVASFCWISCDGCGKLRRVHQPFPGGAPFVCALALNIGSCSVPEQEGLGSVFCSHVDQVSVSDTYESIVGDMVLRDAIGAGASAVAATTTSTVVTSTSSDRTENGATKMSTSGRRLGRSSAVGPHLTYKSSASAKLIVPLLRELTSALRKRALGAFVKNILTVPDEVRAKRESVVRASIVVAGDSRHTDSVSPKHEEQKRDWPEVQNNTLPLGNKAEPHQAEVDNAKSEVGEQQNMNVLPAETNIHVSEVPCKEGVSRPCRRLGCPPRRMKEVAHQGGAKTRMTLVSLPPSEVTRPEGLTEDVTTIKLEAVATPSEVVANTGRTNASLNGTPVKQVTPAPSPEEPMATVAEALSKESPSKKVCGRKRTRSSTTEDAKQNIGNDDGISNTNAICGAKPRGVARRVGSDGITSALNKEEVEVIYWMCCDLCDKWRIVPEKISEDTDHWYCEMRADGTTCSDTDDEIRMNRSKKRGRKRKKENR
ncbi:hypothetical protein TraAM80_00605 [Trypanosoma rangeli]|uniref:CW-type domain-containing protein n=1 Tax=Trypanosoma rangeli TaxID=5698 RepID=A0A422P2G0_TRYRA|nr:uncharacterized protein TraAM80_00605 [Trypanosoma rangeli]RNF11910.1 hypothetical protein TraAM80_00605 [Trypanosoma rangeli]|eukprot:RNF11910.1 hypothetical protein TraAM80_00605 [Trypanosoma rangeli]